MATRLKQAKCELCERKIRKGICVECFTASCGEITRDLRRHRFESNITEEETEQMYDNAAAPSDIFEFPYYGTCMLCTEPVTLFQWCPCNRPELNAPRG